MSNKKFSGAKGYYIALILCAAAIGISGYLYYRNANTPAGEDTAVGATTPLNASQTATSGTSQTEDTRATLPTTRKVFKTAAPLAGETVGEYAMDCLTYNQTTRDWRTHNGMDIAAEAGTPVLAAADGTVYTVYADETMGTTVVIRHEGDYTTVYSSLDETVLVKTGDAVTLGQPIGTVGTTALLESSIGDHLHFAVTKADTPIDPADFLSME